MFEYLSSNVFAISTFQNISFFVVLAVVLYLAWLLTSREPLNYRIWVAQLFSIRTHQLIQLHNMNKRDERHIFWRSPFIMDNNPRVTTIILAQRPIDSRNREVRPEQFSYSSGDVDSPSPEQQQLMARFITEHAQPEVFDQVSSRQAPPQDYSRDYEERPNRAIAATHVSFPTSHRWMVLAEMIQQLHRARAAGEEGSSTDFDRAGPSLHDGIITSHPPRRPSIEISTTPPDISATDNDTTTEEAGSNNSRPITINVRSPDESIVKISTELRTTVLDFKQKCLSSLEQVSCKLLFQGNTLEDDAKTLQDYGLYDDCIVFKSASESENSEEAVFIRLKHLDDRTINAHLPLSTTVGDLKRLHYASDIASGRVIRLIFQGQLLRNDSRTLSSYGVCDQSVIHVHVGNSPYRQEGAQTNNTAPPVEVDNNLGFQPIIVTGFSWLDGILLTLLSSILWLVRWAEADDVLEEDNSIVGRISRWLRTAIRNLTGFITVLFALTDNDQEVQHQFGNLFSFFIIVKITVLCLVPLFFPMVGDIKTVFMLSIIVSFSVMYLWSNRTTQQRTNT